MQRRRERIEKWRAERKKKEIEETKSDIAKCIFNISPLSAYDKTYFFLANLVLPSKAWTLEDDSDEEEDRHKVKHEVEEGEKEKEKEKEKTNGELPIPEAKEEEEEVEVKKEEEVEEDDGIDPLDAYMITVQEEVTKIKQGSKVHTPKEKTSSSSQSGVVFMEGPAKKKDSSKDKGELIEQNQDGLEVSHDTCTN
jgi:ATP-dependent RNA helicase DDX46/PRP5